jgi:hypothetical protein
LQISPQSYGTPSHAREALTFGRDFGIEADAIIRN